MKIKSLCLTFVQLLMFSSLGYANENCQNGDFWQTWFKESQFVGFGNSLLQQIKPAMLN